MRRVLGRSDGAVFERIEGGLLQLTSSQPSLLVPGCAVPVSRRSDANANLQVFEDIDQVLSGRPAPWPAPLVEQVRALLADARAGLPRDRILGHSTLGHLARTTAGELVLLGPPVVAPVFDGHRALLDRELARRALPGDDWAAHSEPGPVRRYNEDSWLVRAAGEGTLWICVDGVGGMVAGDLGVRRALVAVEQAELGLDPAKESLVAMDRCLRALDSEAAFRGVGAAAVAAWVAGPRVELAWVGDCRAYRWRRGALEQLTTDHTLAERMVAMGKLSPEEAADHPHRNILVRSLGPVGELEVAGLTVDRQPGDRLLLTSDGVHRPGGSDIARILASRWGPRDAVQALVRGAAGTGDNATAIVIAS